MKGDIETSIFFNFISPETQARYYVKNLKNDKGNDKRVTDCRSNGNDVVYNKCSITIYQTNPTYCKDTCGDCAPDSPKTCLLYTSDAADE